MSGVFTSKNKQNGNQLQKWEALCEHWKGRADLAPRLWYPKVRQHWSSSERTGKHA